MIQVNDYNAEKIRSWIATRGGVAVWNSCNLSNMRELFCPVLDETGHPNGKPAWDMPDKPTTIITDESGIEVSYAKEVRRFHIAVRRGAQGFMLKCTSASSARIEREVRNAGPGAYYQFDHDSQDAVIFAPEKIIPLTEYKP